MEAGRIENRLAVAEVGKNDYIPKLDYIAVVSKEYLYARERTADKVEFYDLQTDPGAKNNLGQSHPKFAAYAKVAEAEQPNVTAERTELDEQTRKQLESLGYLR